MSGFSFERGVGDIMRRLKNMLGNVPWFLMLGLIFFVVVSKILFHLIGLSSAVARALPIVIWVLWAGYFFFGKGQGEGGYPIKRCPYCDEYIKIKAIRCPECSKDIAPEG